MIYAEASYPFPGTTPHHFHHIAAWEDHRVAERRRKECAVLIERRRGMDRRAAIRS